MSIIKSIIFIGNNRKELTKAMNSYGSEQNNKKLAVSGVEPFILVF